MKTVPGIYDGQEIKPLEAFHARPNTRVMITFLDDDPRPAAFPRTQIEDVAGCLAHDGPTVSVDEMNAAVLRHAKERRR
jgi:hypothetical protein